MVRGYATVVCYPRTQFLDLMNWLSKRDEAEDWQCLSCETIILKNLSTYYNVCGCLRSNTNWSYCWAKSEEAQCWKEQREILHSEHRLVDFLGFGAKRSCTDVMQLRAGRRLWHYNLWIVGNVQVALPSGVMRGHLDFLPGNNKIMTRVGTSRTFSSSLRMYRR